MNTKTLLTLTVRNATGAVVGQISLDETAADNSGPDTSARADDITDAQRRLLFRLAARLGFEGQSARDYIDRRLDAPKDKRAASRLIDDLQEEAKRGNGVGHAGAA